MIGNSLERVVTYNFHLDSNTLNVDDLQLIFAGGSSIRYGKQQNDLDVCNDNVIVVQLVESNTTQATSTGDLNYINVCKRLHNNNFLFEFNVELSCKLNT